MAPWEFKQQIVIGFGTGRCGTRSLAEFLNQQDGYSVTHEEVKLAWFPPFPDFEKAVKEFLLRDGEVIGDIGYYWINFLGYIIRKHPNIRAINITRNLDEVIESFWSYKNPDITSAFQYMNWKSYPFDSYNQTKDAIAQTVKKYRVMEFEIKRYFPGKIFSMEMEELNDTQSLSELLEWLGVKNKKLTTHHINTREEKLAADEHGLYSDKANINDFPNCVQALPK